MNKKRPITHREPILRRIFDPTIDITVKELIDLAQSRINEPELKIQKMFDWYYEQDMMVVKGALATSGSLLITYLIALLKKEVAFELNSALFIFIAILLSSLYGLYRLGQVKSIHKQFVSTLKLYTNVKDISQFINLYQQRYKK